MRITGYCIECRRIRTVRVSGAGMARLATGRAAIGTCLSCEEKERNDRVNRRHR